MDRETRRRLEAYRKHTAGPVENTFIDEAVAGEMDRGELLRRGTMVGLSVPVIGAPCIHTTAHTWRRNSFAKGSGRWRRTVTMSCTSSAGTVRGCGLRPFPPTLSSGVRMDKTGGTPTRSSGTRVHAAGQCTSRAARRAASPTS